MPEPNIEKTSNNTVNQPYEQNSAIEQTTSDFPLFNEFANETLQTTGIDERTSCPTHPPISHANSSPPQGTEAQSTSLPEKAVASTTQVKTATATIPTRNAEQVTKRILNQLTSMDKHNLKMIINNPNAKYDTALKTHARKKLRIEMRKQLRSFNLTDSSELHSTLQNILEPDECIESDKIPEALFEEIGRVLDINLLNDDEYVDDSTENEDNAMGVLDKNLKLKHEQECNLVNAEDIFLRAEMLLMNDTSMLEPIESIEHNSRLDTPTADIINSSDGGDKLNEPELLDKLMPLQDIVPNVDKIINDVIPIEITDASMTNDNLLSDDRNSAGDSFEDDCILLEKDIEVLSVANSKSPSLLDENEIPLDDSFLNFNDTPENVNKPDISSTNAVKNIAQDLMTSIQKRFNEMIDVKELIPNKSPIPTPRSWRSPGEKKCIIEVPARSEAGKKNLNDPKKKSDSTSIKKSDSKKDKSQKECKKDQKYREKESSSRDSSKTRKETSSKKDHADKTEKRPFSKTLTEISIYDKETTNKSSHKKHKSISVSDSSNKKTKDVISKEPSVKEVSKEMPSKTQSKQVVTSEIKLKDVTKDNLPIKVSSLDVPPKDVSVKDNVSKDDASKGSMVKENKSKRDLEKEEVNEGNESTEGLIKEIKSKQVMLNESLTSEFIKEANDKSTETTTISSDNSKPDETLIKEDALKKIISNEVIHKESCSTDDVSKEHVSIETSNETLPKEDKSKEDKSKEDKSKEDKSKEIVTKDVTSNKSSKSKISHKSHKHKSHSSDKSSSSTPTYTIPPLVIHKSAISSKVNEVKSSKSSKHKSTSENSSKSKSKKDRLSPESTPKTQKSLRKSPTPPIKVIFSTSESMSTVKPLRIKLSPTNSNHGNIVSTINPAVEKMFIDDVNESESTKDTQSLSLATSPSVSVALSLQPVETVSATSTSKNSSRSARSHKSKLTNVLDANTLTPISSVTSVAQFSGTLTTESTVTTSITEAVAEKSSVLSEVTDISEVPVNPIILEPTISTKKPSFSITAPKKSTLSLVQQSSIPCTESPKPIHRIALPSSPFVIPLTPMNEQLDLLKQMKSIEEQLMCFNQEKLRIDDEILKLHTRKMHIESQTLDLQNSRMGMLNALITLNQKQQVKQQEILNKINSQSSSLTFTSSTSTGFSSPTHTQNKKRVERKRKISSTSSSEVTTVEKQVKEQMEEIQRIQRTSPKLDLSDKIISIPKKKQKSNDSEKKIQSRSSRSNADKSMEVEKVVEANLQSMDIGSRKESISVSEKTVNHESSNKSAIEKVQSQDIEMTDANEKERTSIIPLLSNEKSSTILSSVAPQKSSRSRKSLAAVSSEKSKEESSSLVKNEKAKSKMPSCSVPTKNRNKKEIIKTDKVQETEMNLKEDASQVTDIKDVIDNKNQSGEDNIDIPLYIKQRQLQVLIKPLCASELPPLIPTQPTTPDIVPPMQPEESTDEATPDSLPSTPPNFIGFQPIQAELPVIQLENLLDIKPCPRETPSPAFDGRFVGHKSPISCMVVQDSYLVAAGEDGNVFRFSLVTGKLEKIFSHHKKTVTGIHVENDEVFSISLDGTMKKFGLEVRISFSFL